MLAAIVLVAQVAASPPNPCADQLSALCRISPLFCPSAYPSTLVPGTNGIPCWPQRDAVAVSTAARPAAPTHSVAPRGSAQQQAAPRSAQAAPAGTARSFFSAAAKLFRLTD